MKKFFCMTAVALLLSGGAIAQENKADVYPSLSDIPAPLRQIAGFGVEYPEQYVDRVLAVIRQSGRDKNSIDRQDIEAAKATRENEQRRIQVQQMMVYDRNFDGKVTRDEVIATLSERNRGMLNEEELSRQVENIMAADANGDGTVTMQEMADFAAKKAMPYSNPRFGQNSPEAFLALDPNGDGRLTVAELEYLARKAFRTMDTDGDGMLSRDEQAAVQKIAMNEMQMGQISPDCKFPPPSADEKIVFIGAYSGKAVSDMSVAGQTQETDVVPVDIAQGAGKLYIVASTFTPAIWQIKGDSGRISHLVLTGPSIVEGAFNNGMGNGINDMGSGPVNAGETGVSADKVVFQRARNCGLLAAYDSQPEKQDYTKFSLKKLLGRMPDLFTAEHDISSLHVSDDHISDDIAASQENSQNQAPEGFDRDAWMTHLRYMPGGLIGLKNEKIVSDAPAVPYEVLPKWAGIAKLVHDGALVPVSDREARQTLLVTSPGGQTDTLIGISNLRMNGGNSTVEFMRGGAAYKIVKNIPYYPSGLFGGFSTRFIIARGVDVPKGSPGHSRVVCEETSRPPVGQSCH